MNQFTAYGCPASSLDGLSWEMFRGLDWKKLYVVTARCSDGCHVFREYLQPDEVPDLLPDVEHAMRAAFRTRHPEAA